MKKEKSPATTPKDVENTTASSLADDKSLEIESWRPSNASIGVLFSIAALIVLCMAYWLDGFDNAEMRQMKIDVAKLQSISEQMQTVMLITYTEKGSLADVSLESLVGDGLLKENVLSQSEFSLSGKSETLGVVSFAGVDIEACKVFVDGLKADDPFKVSDIVDRCEIGNVELVINYEQ